MPNYEKIQLGFDEAFLQDQLQKTYGNFDQFAQGVRAKLDESIFSEESLRRMYVANERLREYTAMLQQVEIKKSQIASTDEVALKRLEAEKSHLAAGQSREAWELELARRGMPSSDMARGSQQGSMGGLGMFMGSAVAAAGMGLGSAALGHEIGSIAQGVGGVVSAYKKRDPVTGERDDQAISAAWGNMGVAAAKFAVSEIIKGWSMEAQEAAGRTSLFQAQGYDAGEERFRNWSRADFENKFGMRKIQAIPLLEQLGRQTGGSGGFEDILNLQRQTGLGGEGVGMMGAAAQRGVSEIARIEILGKAAGLAMSENLPKGRFGEVLSDISRSIAQGRGALDIDAELNLRLAAARAGGAEYMGQRGGDLATRFGGIGTSGGVGEGVAIMLQMQQGKGFIDAKMGAEKGYFKTAEGQKQLIGYLNSNFKTRDQRILMLSQMASSGFVDADLFNKMLGEMDQGHANVGATAAGGRASVATFGGIEKYEDVGPRQAQQTIDNVVQNIGKAVIQLPVELFTAVSHADDPMRAFKHVAGGMAHKQWDLLKERFGQLFSGQGFHPITPKDIGNLMDEEQNLINDLGTPEFRSRTSSQGGPGGGEDALDLGGATISDPKMLADLKLAAAEYYKRTKKKLHLGGIFGGDRTAAQQAELRRRHAGDPSFPVAKDYSQHEAHRALDIPALRDNPELLDALMKHGFIKPKRLNKDGVDTDPVHVEYTGSSGGADRPLSRAEVNKRVEDGDGTRVDVDVRVSKAPHKQNDTSGQSGIPNKGRGLSTTNNRPNGATNG